jgi:hypothetical protein
MNLVRRSNGHFVFSVVFSIIMVWFGLLWIIVWMEHTGFRRKTRPKEIWREKVGFSCKVAYLKSIGDRVFTASLPTKCQLVMIDDWACLHSCSCMK